MVVGAVALLALAALEQVGLRTLHGGQLGVVDRLLLELLAQHLDLVVGHLLGAHHGQPGRRDGAHPEVGAQRRVLGVLQVGKPRPDPVLVVPVRVLELLEDRLLQLFGQFFCRRTACTDIV